MHYFKILRFSLTKPRSFFSKLKLKATNNQPLFFLLTNLLLSHLLGYLVLGLENKSFIVPFLVVNQFLFTLPAILFLILIYLGFLHLLARLFAGQGSFKHSFQAFCFASGPLILTRIPFLGILAWGYQGYLLCLAFRRFHNYSTNRAILTVVIPFLISILGLILLGLHPFIN